MKKLIAVRTQFEGIHCYPDAPEEVRFLRHPHRHVFHVELQIEVYHNDRELEFIIVKRNLEVYINQTLKNVSSKSCEAMAELIRNYAHERWGENRLVNVGVFEDGENGAWIREDL
ncbi:MAG TPA: hypothetical protein PLD61_07345 [Bacillota bacterium]|nr:hypothetical protein [Bacillota bacterium]